LSGFIDRESGVQNESYLLSYRTRRYGHSARLPLTEHTALAQALQARNPERSRSRIQRRRRLPTHRKNRRKPASPSPWTSHRHARRLATTQHGDIIPGLKRKTSASSTTACPRHYHFGATDAPITMFLLLDSAAAVWRFLRLRGEYWSTALFPALLQKDWVALETFDMKTRVEVDFTQTKTKSCRGCTAFISRVQRIERF